MDRWLVSLDLVGATGNATQCYPVYAPTGVNPATATPSQQVRMPCEGQLVSLQICSDGTNGGTLSLWDMSGHEAGIDVSSGTTITDTQLDTAVANGNARLILKQNFAGSGLTPWAPVGPSSFMRGLVARATGATGSCDLNMVVHGGYRLLNGTV